MDRTYQPRNARVAVGYLPVLLAAAFSFLALALPIPSSAQLPVIRFVRDPDPAPEVKTKDLDGKDLSLDEFKGKVVLLNFWATWCGPCRAEIPGLIELQSRYKDRMQVIGMTVDADDEDDLRAVIKDEGINYPVVITSMQTRIDYGGIAALPTLFVINADGKVVQKHVGLYNPALYETEIRALLNLPVDAKVETFDDTGEVFLKHADRATSLPGVNTSQLTTEQRMAVLHKLNAEGCSCGCKMTLAQCRIYDPACGVSKDRATAIVKEASAAGEKAEKPASPAAPDAAPTVAPDATPATPAGKQ
jgi:thiol-disulfide isomerase/thioredoxin